MATIWDTHHSGEGQPRLHPQHGEQGGKEHQQLGVISKEFRCPKECKEMALKGVPRVDLTEPRDIFACHKGSRTFKSGEICSILQDSHQDRGTGSKASSTAEAGKPCYLKPSSELPMSLGAIYSSQ